MDDKADSSQGEAQIDKLESPSKKEQLTADEQSVVWV